MEEQCRCWSRELKTTLTNTPWDSSQLAFWWTWRHILPVEWRICIPGIMESHNPGDGFLRDYTYLWILHSSSLAWQQYPVSILQFVRTHYSRNSKGNLNIWGICTSLRAQSVHLPLWKCTLLVMCSTLKIHYNKCTAQTGKTARLSGNDIVFHNVVQ